MWSVERIVYWFLPYAPFVLSAIISYPLSKKLSSVIKPFRYGLTFITLWAALSWLFLLLVRARHRIVFGYEGHWLYPYVEWLRVDPIFVQVIPFATSIIGGWAILWVIIYYFVNKKSPTQKWKILISFLTFLPIILVIIAQFAITFLAE